MIVYADASALTKRHIEETSSPETLELLGAAEILVTSLITRAEITAAIVRASRGGRITAVEAEEQVAILVRDWEWLNRVPIDEDLIESASELARKWPLRGYDAVHLASALRFRPAYSEPLTVATFDAELWHAAAGEGLGVWPAALPVRRG